MEKFKTILEKEVSDEIVEKKSRFIATLIKVESVQDAEQKIKEIKSKYHDAKHNCFAFIINDNGSVTKRFSDDGEPSGTAGAPMLEILEKMNVANVLVVVTRYFGGILLGTGGLLRAYSDSLKKAINTSTIVENEIGFEVEIKISYSDFEKIKYFCEQKKIRMYDISFSDVVMCKIDVNNSQKSIFEDDINAENRFNILDFDIIRQKNIPVVSK